MTAPRTRKQAKAYKQHMKETSAASVDCVFCSLKAHDVQFVTEHSYFKVVHNLFPYSYWDNQPVIDHLLLIPKLHTETLSALDAKAALEFIELVSEYESIGYNVYARAPGSIRKTVEHQHTHLIKLSDRKIRAMFYVRKPYIRFVIK